MIAMAVSDACFLVAFVVIHLHSELGLFDIFYVNQF